MFLAKLLVFIIILITGTDGYHASILFQCTYISRDLSDVELIYSISFNKAVQIQFNSTFGKFLGFTEIGVKHAHLSNNDPQILSDISNLVNVCKHYGEIGYPAIVDKFVQPKIKLRSMKLVGRSSPAVLVCSAYDFYPEQIKVSWLRDGREMTTDAMSTEELADGDWYYQIHSHLEYTPKPGEKISCMVDHGSLIKPMIIDWDPSISESDRNKIAIGSSGLVLGIIIATAGFIYYKKKISRSTTHRWSLI
ncbi:rano class II histocompatibility antigen, A beta chain-like [Rhinichthys klamathensis goyatoka]|uniref:rano class II histocompatibility antigen, A beta chain-like n=1 Tax=Rhinichthys klamathensis goyatoka TaxID=3034132 RepID=UPI0024B4A5B7|nr:rano class II histocompatibility antigen, A beta chain-like [Rhinichthys klamathensis goyatoka]